MSVLWIIDDNSLMLNSLELALGDYFNVRIFSNPMLCAAALEKGKPDMVLTDFDMEGMNGLELIKLVLQEYPDILCFLFSADLSENLQTKAKALGVRACLGKPFDLQAMIAMLKS